MHDQLTELLKNAGFSDKGEADQASNPRGSGSTGSQDSESTQAIQQATEAITQLQAATQGSVDSLTANTDALAQTTQSSSSGSAGSAVGDVASGLLGGGSSLGGGLLGGGLSLLFDGIENLFGGGTSEPAPLTTYTPPAAQDFQLATSKGTTGDAVYDSSGLPRESDVAQTAINNVRAGAANGPSESASGNGSGQGSSTSGQQVTVQVQAMDSQSFMDRSGDIATAVRQAMLNMHSINDVVNDL